MARDNNCARRWLPARCQGEPASKRATRPLGQVAQCSGSDAIVCLPEHTKPSHLVLVPSSSVDGDCRDDRRFDLVSAYGYARCSNQSITTNAERHSATLRCSRLFFSFPILSWARVYGSTACPPYGTLANFPRWLRVTRHPQCSVHCAVSRLNRATRGRGQLTDSIAASFALMLRILSLPIQTFKRRKLSNGTWNVCSDFCRFGSSLRYARPLCSPRYLPAG